MKTNFVFVTAALMALCLGFSSCKDKNKGNNDQTAVTEQLSPEENKEHLVSVADKISSKFNTRDQQEAIDLADGLIDKYEDYDFEGLQDVFVGEFEKMMKMPKYVIGVLQGNHSPAATPEEAFNFDYTKFCVEFEADEQNKTWINRGQTTDNSVILRFKDKNGTQCEAKCQALGQVKTYQVDIDGNSYIANAPAKVVFYLKKGNTEIVRVEVEQNIDLNAPSVAISTYAKVANLSWKEDANITKTSASAAFKILCSDEAIISVVANLPSYQMIDKPSYEDFDDWFEDIADQYDRIARTAKGCDGSLDLMGMVQAKAKIYNAGEVYGQIYDWAQRDHSERDRAYMQQLCDIINNGQENGLYYNSDTKQAEIRMQLMQEGEYYYPEPVLYFPQDGTSYAFDGYFDINQGPFAQMMQTFEDLANKYIALARVFDPNIPDIDITPNN